MRVFNYSEARQNFATILNLACKEDVIISKKDGQKFKLIPIINTEENKSPFNIKSISCKVSTQNIIDVIRDSRETL